MPDQQPWLQNKRWADNRIASDAQAAQWVLWGFALFWNLVSLPLVFQFRELWRKIPDEPAVALAFLFPLVGLGLVAAAVYATRQKRRFGRTPLVLAPFPGSLGGNVGGTIYTGIPYDPDVHFGVRIECIYSHISGSGKNRSRSETLKWQSDGVCQSEMAGGGTHLRFRFDVPAGLPASDVKAGSHYHLWRLSVTAELDGPDFSRSYRIPVFATGAQRSTIEQGTESHAATVDAAMEGVNSVADIRPVPGGIEALFPALQRPGQGIFALLFGLVFAAVGIVVLLMGESLLLGLLFTLMGSLIAAHGAWYLGKSLIVSVTQEGLRARRFLFGYPVTTRQLSQQQAGDFEIVQGATMRSGNKTTVFYQLRASGGQVEPFVVAERLTSRSEAELVKETYQAYLGKFSA